MFKNLPKSEIMNTYSSSATSTIKLMKRNRMSSQRKTSLIAGLLYVVTFVSIPTLALYGPIHKPSFISGAGSDTAVILGGILEIIVALAGIATAVVLFPVLRKQHDGAALGLVAARVLEAGTIFVGVAFLLSILSLRQAGAGTESSPTIYALITLYDRIFQLGQGFIPAINDLLLGILLYKSRLVPRFLSLLGIIGAIPLIAGFLALLFNFIDRISPMAALSAVLVALFEFSLGIYLIVKGFKRSPLTVGV
jgi:hypothetical protein